MDIPDYDVMKLIDTKYYEKKRTTATVRVYVVKTEDSKLIETEGCWRVINSIEEIINER